MKFKEFANGVLNSAKKHSPEILVGVGIVGMITGGIFAVKATPKALTLMEEEKKKQNVEKLGVKDTVKATWKCYIPAVAMEVAGAACIVGSSAINFKRNAMLAAAYGISESALKEYKQKVIETVGEKKEKAVHDAIAKDRMEKDPVTNKEVIISPSGDTLCYDELSGRYFKSNIEIIKGAQNECNRRLLNEGYITLNEFYSEVGLPDIGIGDNLGWEVDDGYLDLSYSSQLANDGTPCLVIGHYNPPTYGIKNVY